MKSGLKAFSILLLFAGLVFVNYLAGHFSLRLDATEGKVYTLTPGTRSIVANLAEPLTLDYYFSSDVAGMPIQIKDYADQVREMLKQYVRLSGGKITLNVINPKVDTKQEEDATAAGLQPLNDPNSGADPVYFGLVATEAAQSKSLPGGFSPQREQLLEYDISQLIYSVQHAQDQKKAIGLITSLPLNGTPPESIMGQGQPGQYVTTAGGNNYNLKTIAPDAEKLPDGLAALAVIHPENLSPKLQFAIDQYLLSGKPVFLALDSSSEYFKRQGGQQQQLMMMMGGAQPNVASDLPDMLKAYGIDYDSASIVGDPAHATVLQNPRSGALLHYIHWLSLDRDSISQESPVTAQLKSFIFIESGSLAVKPAPGVTVTPLVETSDQAGLIPAATLQFAKPEDLGRQLKSSGKKTLAALIQGKLKSAFPDGLPETKPTDTKIGTPPPAATPMASPALKESSSTSTLLVVADTDWMFDEYIFDPNMMQAGLLSPRNDNLDFANNILDFLTGSSELLSVRGKGAVQRPFKVVTAMEEKARKQYEDQLTILETRLTDVQKQLSEIQAKRTDGGRLVATPEMQKKIDDFHKQEAGLRSEQRKIRLTLREDIDSLGRRLLWVNLLTTPILIGIFGLWFGRNRRR